MPMIHRKTVAAGLAGGAVACLLALPILADDNDRTGPRLKGWGQVIDPDRDCDIAFQDGAVSIMVPGAAHDFAAELGRQNAPRVLAELKGDFVAEVKVSGAFKPGDLSVIPGRRPYQGAGLLVIKDKDNYVSLHRGCVTLDDKVRHYANFELRKDGQLAISRFEIEIPDQDTYLRLERRGGRVFNATSPDGIHWTSYDPIELEMPEAAQFGIVGISSSKVPLSIKFQDLTVFRRAEVE
jgi:regulation of enolase protein 1 (concanavalin A-like superfamily)